MPDVYSVEILSRAENELNSLPTSVMKRVAEVLAAMSGNPRPMGCKKLIGAACRYRIRVGDYRILYEIIEARKSVAVYRIRHRSDAYR